MHPLPLLVALLVMALWQIEPAGAATAILTGGGGVVFALVVAIIAFYRGSVVSARMVTQLTESYGKETDALVASHAAALAAVQAEAAAQRNQHESERALLVQQIADQRAERQRVEADWQARLAQAQDMGVRWQDMALGLLKVQDSQRRELQGRPTRKEAT